MMRKSRKRFNSSEPTGLVKLGDVLPQFITRFGLQKRKDAEHIAEAWRESVGPPFDAVTRVVGFTRGTLEISVPHPAFVQELSFRQAELLNLLQTALPAEKIKKIKFLVQS